MADSVSLGQLISNSLPSNAGEGPSLRGGQAKNYAFGSSTPRSLSHLGSIAKEQRVYDAKLERTVDRRGLRSATNPQLVAQSEKALN